MGRVCGNIRNPRRNVHVIELNLNTGVGSFVHGSTQTLADVVTHQIKMSIILYSTRVL